MLAHVSRQGGFSTFQPDLLNMMREYKTRQNQDEKNEE